MPLLFQQLMQTVKYVYIICIIRKKTRIISYLLITVHYDIKYFPYHLIYNNKKWKLQTSI